MARASHHPDPMQASPAQPPGVHCLVELYGCPAEVLDDTAVITAALRQAAEAGLATLLNVVTHHFEPQGVTALALISESHIAIHTWPERGYAAVDVFTCGDQANAEHACAALIEALCATRHTITTVARGTDV